MSAAFASAEGANRFGDVGGPGGAVAVGGGSARGDGSESTTGGRLETIGAAARAARGVREIPDSRVETGRGGDGDRGGGGGGGDGGDGGDGGTTGSRGADRAVGRGVAVSVSSTGSRRRDEGVRSRASATPATMCKASDNATTRATPFR
jgi:hypothetical protein